ncbi:MAG TPA: sugar transferase [Thermoleophilaceae bacterium]|jgi:exopolysaccharide biosynthesis polyprenyl glycosylphosphotransferase|nr:sugar transferase [Thermoleophilaceae bacterium]
MPQTSLTERTLAALAPGELGWEELESPQRARRRDAVGRLALLTADALAVVAAWLIVASLPFSSLHVTWWIAAYVPFFALVAKAAGLYDRDQFVLHKTTLDEAPKLVGVAAIYALTMEGMQTIHYTGGSHPLWMWGVFTVTLVLFRGFARFVAVRTTPTERVLVIGDAATAAAIRRKLSANPALNATVIGRVGEREETGDRPDKVLGTLAELPELVERHEIERVIVEPVEQPGGDVVDVIRLASACGVRVAVLPHMLEAIGTSVDFDDLGGQMLLGVRNFGLSPSSRVLKRCFDVVVAVVALILLSPLLLVIAAAIKLTSRGPALFRQTRVGRQGRDFEVLKFRTMVSDADQRKQELADLNQAAPMFKIANDPRITRIGQFLRRRSLDELPQLLNVLRGDMSIVGPRPLIGDEDRLFSGWQRRRYHVAPGITGPWQILGSSRVPMSDMVTIDYLYCANWSLWLDTKILLRTIPYVLSRRSPEFGE